MRSTFSAYAVEWMQRAEGSKIKPFKVNEPSYGNILGLTVAAYLSLSMTRRLPELRSWFPFEISAFAT